MEIAYNFNVKEINKLSKFKKLLPKYCIEKKKIL